MADATFSTEPDESKKEPYLPLKDDKRTALYSKFSFTCPECGMTSHNPNDVREGYCNNCHKWTG
jgi:hypothetical protein